MNKKLLGVTFAAVFAVALISAPIAADAITDLVKTKIKIDDDEYEKIKFKLADKVPTNGEVFGGYAVFTDGDVIAVTSHQGAYDSERQDFDDEDTTFALCSPAQIAAGLCGPEWHSHLVVPDTENPRCEFAAVGAITFEEPSEKLKVKGKKITVKDIEIETDDFTNSLTGLERDFTAGLPTSDGVAFDLNAAFDGSGNLEAVCIGDVIPLPANNPPTIESVTLIQVALGGDVSDSFAVAQLSVDCIANGIMDADGDLVTLSFEWLSADGTLIATGDTLPANTVLSTSIVTCKVTPFDGTDFGASASRSVTLLGIPGA